MLRHQSPYIAVSEGAHLDLSVSKDLKDTFDSDRLGLTEFEAVGPKRSVLIEGRGHGATLTVGQDTTYQNSMFEMEGRSNCYVELVNLNITVIPFHDSNHNHGSPHPDIYPVAAYVHRLHSVERKTRGSNCTVRGHKGGL